MTQIPKDRRPHPTPTPPVAGERVRAKCGTAFLENHQRSHGSSAGKTQGLSLLHFLGKVPLRTGYQASYSWVLLKRELDFELQSTFWKGFVKGSTGARDCLCVAVWDT